MSKNNDDKDLILNDGDTPVSSLCAKYDSEYILQVEPSTVTEHIEGVGKSGSPYDIWKQTGWLHSEHELYPQKLSFVIVSEKDNLKTGFYKVKNALTCGSFDSLAINRNILFVPCG